MADNAQSLLDSVIRACKRLAEHGWSDLFNHHGLNIKATDLAGELLKPLQNIDRTLPGFEDFALEAYRGIEPGKPSHSLLFHALASPRVLLSPSRRPLGDFPSLAELEAVENYVFGVHPLSVQDIRVRADDAPLAIVVFALEYRPAIGTVHQRHADMCFSRTGITRVGTNDPHYDPAERGFSPIVDKDAHGLRVLPCRYAPFIAGQYLGDKSDFGPIRFRVAGDTVLGSGASVGLTKSTIGDADRKFWVPIHKLFSGKECIRGRDLTVGLSAHHVNQKLRKVHLALLSQGHVTGWCEPQISDPPFIFSDGIAKFSADADAGNWLLAPIVHSALVEPAKYKGKPLTFLVPPDNKPYSSSFNITAKKSGARGAPEYVHARHKVANGKIEDLNKAPEVVKAVQKGGYEAQHYIDYTGDGYIQVECKELVLDVARRIPAYSVVAPPDFFPMVKQQDLMDWWEQSVPPDVQSTIWPINPGPPRPLSDERYPANLSFAQFDSTDDTISSIVSLRGAGREKPTEVTPAPAIRRVSSLPDRAAGIFAPGWDCSIDRTEEVDPDDNGVVVLPGVTHLAAYGLGSPFPEDAKLCSALSSFWPAAAPDTTRTFEPGKYAITTPLPDEVIGQTGKAPWDGIPGPKIAQGYPNEVEYSALAYGDWVEAALNKTFDYDAIANTHSEEYEARTLIMSRVYETLGATKTEEKKLWCLLSFATADKYPKERSEAEASTSKTLALSYAYRFVMFQHKGTRTHPAQFNKQLVRYEEFVQIFADPQLVLVQGQNGTWTAYEY